MKALPFLALALLFLDGDSTPDRGGHERVRGMTISCQTWGWEWGSDGFAEELDRLGDLGANWVAIHPYAGIRGDGSVVHRRGQLEEHDPPVWVARPIAVAREKRFASLVKPHLAYWGSPFPWRGEIGFEVPEERERFWRDYTDWIVRLARVARDADAFCVGTELDRMLADEAQWRGLIERVRAVTDARLTYAANWDRFDDVPFWDALDAIGVQAYFPLAEGEDPTTAELRAGWERVLAPLRELSRQTGKPVVFTELGYSASPRAASHPWEDPARGAAPEDELQERCLAVGLDVLGDETEWLRGAFLWKWFVGEPHRGDHGFYLDTPGLRAVIRGAWAPE